LSDRFEKHARTVTVLTFLSRLTGLARDAALARIFGLSAIIDAFWFAFIIPNLFRRLFGEGALSAAFLPIFTKLDRDDPPTSRALARLTISAMLIVLGGITLIAELILWMLLARISPDDHSHLAVRLMMIMLPYMPLVCIVAIVGTMLQVYGKFGPMAAAPVVLNACIVAAAVGGPNLAIWRFGDLAIEDHVTIVALSVIVAGILQVVWSILALQRAVKSPDRQWGGAKSPDGDVSQHFKRMLRQALPMFIGLGVLQLNAFFDNFIAGYPTAYGSTIAGYEFPLKPGALTALSNAQRLYEFPLGVFGIAVATAIFPALARVAGDGEDDRRRFADTVRRGLRLVVFIGVPASVGLVLVRQQLTAVVFYGERFTAADVDRVAFVLLGYAPAIWAYSMIHTLTRAFYAKGDSMTPVKVAVGMVMLNLALNMTLIWTPLREAGLAWSTALCSTVQVLILLRLSRRFAQNLIDEAVRASWLKTVGVTALMAAAVWVAGELLPQREFSWRWSAIELAAMVGAGAAAVWACAAMLGMPELRWALGKSRTTESPGTV
jgi:putative peptidoglycan lipid II flippase